MNTPFDQSRSLQKRAHELIPGGAHTYAKGDDQFPVLAPGFIRRGQGSHVWDVDGNEYIEYGMGCRAVALGHAFEPIVEAVQNELQFGTNFSRPNPLEVECAEELLSVLPFADMCKFCKNGSDATTAALKLARAATGRDKIAICRDHPFFSVDDWFIGTTAMASGIPTAIQDMTLTFAYNDIASLEQLMREHPGEIAAVILEPAKYSDPEDHFLHRVKECCESNESVFILDEMITGFRWPELCGQNYYNVEPDLSTFGKALANGFSLSALAGKRELMDLGGIYHDRDRVFLLSTTHGAESHSLAAGIATIKYYKEHPVTSVMEKQGQKLKSRLLDLIQRHQLQGVVDVIGKPANLVFATRDSEGNPSQAFRTLMMQELIRNGVIGPSLVISYSHSDADIDQTELAFDHALKIYRQAIEEGVDSYLIGRPSQTVYETQSQIQFQRPPDYFSQC